MRLFGVGVAADIRSRTLMEFSLQGQRHHAQRAHRYLQVIHCLSDAPLVTLQSCPTLLQRDAVHGSLDLPITPGTNECRLQKKLLKK